MAVSFTPSGCSLGADEEPQPASGAPRAIAATVDRLERAVAARDFATVCNELFTVRARERSGGDDCPGQLESAAEGVRRPRLELRAIEVKGDRATVEVASEAAGQARVRDELELRRQGGGWLIESLR